MTDKKSWNQCQVLKIHLLITNHIGATNQLKVYLGMYLQGKKGSQAQRK